MKSECILREITEGIDVEMFGKISRGIHEEILVTIPGVDSLAESQEKYLKEPFFQQSE